MPLTKGYKNLTVHESLRDWLLTLSDSGIPADGLRKLHSMYVNGELRGSIEPILSRLDAIEARLANIELKLAYHGDVIDDVVADRVEEANNRQLKDTKAEINEIMKSEKVDHNTAVRILTQRRAEKNNSLDDFDLKDIMPVDK